MLLFRRMKVLLLLEYKFYLARQSTNVRQLSFTEGPPRRMGGASGPAGPVPAGARADGQLGREIDAESRRRTVVGAGHVFLKGHAPWQ